MFPSYHEGPCLTKGFALLLRPFLQAAGLPFADVLSAEQVQAAFAAEGISFGDCANAIFTPAVTLWAWLSR